MTIQTISPSDIDFYEAHETEALRKLVERSTNDSAYMASNGHDAMADEAMRMANAAWGQLVLRGEA